MDVELHKPLKHSRAKQTESGYALIKAASLPFENFGQRGAPRVPALYPTPESQLSDMQVFDAGIATNLNGYLEIAPNLLTGISHTRNTSALTYTSLSGYSYFEAKESNTVTDAQNTRLYSPGADKFVGLTTEQYMPLTSATLAGNFYASIEDPWRTDLSVRFDIETAPGVWSTAGGAVIEAGQQSATVAFSVPAFTKIKFTLISVSSGFRGVIATSIRVTAGTISGFDGATSMVRMSWPYLRELPDVHSYRRIMLDALVSYTGSDLKNGGAIACALVPYDWAPQGADPYSSIASLRNDASYNPLKDGGHVTWRPHDMRDLLPISNEEHELPSSKLVFGYRFDEAEASLRVRSFVMFGIYSPNPIVGRMLYTPAMTPDMLEALSEYYDHYPVATANFNHAILKVFKKGASGAAKTIQALLEHDNAIASALIAMGQPEIAAAVKTAGSINRTIKSKNNARAIKKK